MNNSNNHHVSSTFEYRIWKEPWAVHVGQRIRTPCSHGPGPGPGTCLQNSRRVLPGDLNVWKTKIRVSSSSYKGIWTVLGGVPFPISSLSSPSPSPSSSTCNSNSSFSHRLILEMGSGSSRLGPRPSRPRLDRRRKSRLAPFFCGASRSQAPIDRDDDEVETGGDENPFLGFLHPFFQSPIFYSVLISFFFSWSDITCWIWNWEKKKG